MRQHESEDLRNWLTAALDGSPQALEDLLEAFRRPLGEIADLKLGSSSKTRIRASDLVQESLLAAAASFSQFRGKNLGEFRIWIAQILEDRAKDLARKSPDPMGDVSQEQKNGRAPAKKADHPESPIHEQAVYKDTLKRLLEVLDGLSEEDRNLIHWRFQDGLSFDEIGNKLGWPAKTTRRRWYKLVERVGLHIEGSHHVWTSSASR